MEIAALVGATLLLVTLAVITYSDRENSYISISERAAKNQRSYLIFACSLSVCGSLLLIYLLRSFGPQFGLPVTYYIALFAGWVLLLLTAWIPDHGPRSFKNPHWKTAFGLAVSMTVMTMSLVAARHISVTVRLVSTVASLWYCYTLYVWLFRAQAFQLFLRYESINIASFLGVIVLTLVFR
jgi:hypothetical protein